MRGRPRTPLLDAGRIAAEALALMDADGVEAFTMARLAGRLGVRAPSLYNHVGGKAAIVEAVRDLIVADIDWSGFATRPWDDALEAFARSYRGAFARHPATVPLLTATPVQAPGALAMYDGVSGALVDAGWPVARVVSVIASVEYLVLGSVLDMATGDEMFSTAEAAGATRLAACVRAAALDHDGAADAAFDLGLAGLLSGLRFEHARHAAAPDRRRSSGGQPAAGSMSSDRRAKV